MADRRGILIPLIILCWIVLAPNSNRSPISSNSGTADVRRIEDAIADEQRWLGLVQNSSYGFDFAQRKRPEDEKNEEEIGSDGAAWRALGNLTGLEPTRDYAWDALGRVVQSRVHKQLKYSLGTWGLDVLDNKTQTEDAEHISNPKPPLYANVTGHARGFWQKSEVQSEVAIPHLNLSEYAVPGPFGQMSPPSSFQRNITGVGGEVAIRLHEEYLTDPHAYQAELLGRVTELNAQMKITDTATYEEWEMKLYGVHFVDLGQAIVTTTSDKFAGIFMLPHFTLSESTFSQARALLNNTIERVIRRQISGKTEALNPWTASLEGSQETYSAPECDMIVYLQQMTPLTTKEPSVSLLSFLEHELRFPSGAILPRAPSMRFSMVAFSPDCGFVLESKGPPEAVRQDGNHLVGPKMEVEYRHGRHHLLIFTFTLALQLFLLMRQMHEANTPSTRSRISFYTIAMLALGDGFTTMTFLLISLFISGLWINLVATAFLAFVNVSFFGMRFLMDIWAVQAPERARRAREQIEEQRRRQEEQGRTAQRSRAERSASTAGTDGIPQQETSLPPTEPSSVSSAEARSMSDSLPAPVTAGRPGRLIDTGAMPIFIPSDQDDPEPATDAEVDLANPTAATTEPRIPSFAALYTRFYLLLLGMLFLSLNASSWSAPVSRVYFTLQALAYLSFWVPQIYRNVQRNCRHALKWEFVVGQSVLRLVPFAYFYSYPENVLYADPDLIGLALLVIWVWVQVVFLISQNIIGPRWFWLGFAPPAFDYHPILRDGDEEGGIMPIGFSQAASVAASTPSTPIVERSRPDLDRRPSTYKDIGVSGKGRRIFDCAICMQDLEVHVVEAGATGTDAAGLLARRAYMVTPCRHIFHSACLEGWMKYRLQCPICRETLPPL